MPRAFRFAAATVLIAIAVAVFMRPSAAPPPAPPVLAPTVSIGPSNLTAEDRVFLKNFAALTREAFDNMSEDERQMLLLKVSSVSARLPDISYDEPLTQSGEIVLMGTLIGADAFHPAQGHVTVQHLRDGSLLARLEGLSVRNAPILRLALSADSEGDPRDHPVPLGVLKANMGAQTYVIPTKTALSAVKSLSIYAPPFNTVSAYAELR